MNEMINRKNNLSAPISFQDAIDLHPLTASPEIVLSEALELLNQVKNDPSLLNLTAEPSNISMVVKKSISRHTCLLIVENERLIGLVTEMDFVKFAFLELEFNKVKISEVMSKNLITLSESDSWDVFSVLSLFRQHKIRHLPILTKEQKILGIISQDQISKLIRPNDLLKLKQVRDVIDDNVIHASPNASLWNLVELMVENKSTYVLITEKDQKNNLQPLGIVTERDIIQFEALEVNLKTTQARDVMSYPLFSIDINKSLWQAHQEMEKRGIRRLIVLGNYGELAGILTETNLAQTIDPVELLTTIDILKKQVEKRTKKIANMAEREQLISKIAKQINQSLDLDEILNIIVTEVRRILSTDRAIVYRFNLDWSGTIEAESVIKENLAIFGEIIKNLDCEQNWLDNYRQGEVKIINDTSIVPKLDLTYKEILKKYRIVSTLAVPILLKVEEKKTKSVKKSLWGILILHQCKASYPWKLEEVEFLQKLANHLAIAIQHFQLINLLQKELNQREEYEISLRETKDNVEKKVSQRTVQLQQINEQLQEEIKEHQFTEKSLQNINLQLTSKIEELEQRHQESLLLSNTIDFLQVCLNLEEAYQAIATLVQPLFSTTSGAIFKVDPYKDCVEAVAHWGEDLKSEKLFSLQKCWALRRSRLHWVEDIQIGLTCKHIDDISTRSETLCLPMIAQGEAIAMLYLRAKPGTLKEPQRKLASAIAEHTALALANLKLREKLEKDSIRDNLTSLFNRSYTEEFLQQEIARAQRKQYQIGVIVIDIDNFQEYQDIFSREVSNLILKKISLFLRQNIRTYDVACRYSNKKIVLILPEAALEDVTKRVRQLKEQIEDLNLEYRNRSLSHVSLSVGISSFPQHGVSPKILIKVAEEALERAKSQESDRIEIA